MTISRSRGAAAVLLGVLGSVLVTAGTAVADTPDAIEPSNTISTGQAILIFVVLPLAIDALIALAVLAPGWTRGGRSNGSAADPLTLDAAAPAAVSSSAVSSTAGSPELEAAHDGEPGGTSAQW
jgi:hypothetical protein